MSSTGRRGARDLNTRERGERGGEEGGEAQGGQIQMGCVGTRRERKKQRQRGTEAGTVKTERQRATERGRETDREGGSERDGEREGERERRRGSSGERQGWGEVRVVEGCCGTQGQDELQKIRSRMRFKHVGFGSVCELR